MIQVEYLTSKDLIFWGYSRTMPFREHGPTLITDDGDVSFSVNGLPGYNRNTGPSCVYRNGFIVYRNNKKIHRTTGPAVIREDGSKEYWVNNEQIQELEYFAEYGHT